MDPLGEPAPAEQPQAEDNEEGRHQDRALDEIRHGVDSDGIQREERDREAQRRRILVRHGVLSRARARRRRDRAQDFPIQRPQRHDDSRVNQEVEQALLPPTVAEERR